MKLKQKITAALLGACLLIPGSTEARHLILRTLDEPQQPAYRVLPPRGVLKKRQDDIRRDSYQTYKDWNAPTYETPEVSEGTEPVFFFDEAAIKRARRWEMLARDAGGTLLFSSSPEYVERPGLLYEGIVNGKARLLYYHVNDTGLYCRMAVIVENLNDHDKAVINVTKGGLGVSEDSYIEAAKRIQFNYMNDTYEDTFKLKPHERTLLHRYMDQPVINPGQLAEGIFDFESDEPVRVSVLMLEENAGTTDFMHIANMQGPDHIHMRGTFEGMNRYFESRHVYHPETDGIIFFTIGDNRHDFFKTGIDQTDNSEVTNFGNYGVNYHIKVKTQGYGRTHYYLRPLGGMYAGTVKITYGWKKFQRLICTPSNSLYFGVEGLIELADLGSYESNAPTEIIYMPPPGSFLPVQIILVPEPTVPWAPQDEYRRSTIAATGRDPAIEPDADDD